MGEPGGHIDEGFVQRVAARGLNIEWSKIDDVPDHVINAAYTDWAALRDADFRLQASLAGAKM